MPCVTRYSTKTVGLTPNQLWSGNMFIIKENKNVQTHLSRYYTVDKLGSRALVQQWVYHMHRFKKEQQVQIQAELTSQSKCKQIDFIAGNFSKPKLLQWTLTTFGKIHLPTIYTKKIIMDPHSLIIAKHYVYIHIYFRVWHVITGFCASTSTYQTLVIYPSGRTHSTIHFQYV